ncbi:MAG: hypothetical protein H0V07_13655 [Propionibacteriales bacterium]|nr:hypothetical protein [Propionibacteriales bacterium]
MNKQAEWLTAYVEKCMKEGWGGSMEAPNCFGDIVSFRSGTTECTVRAEDDWPMMVRVMATAVQDARLSLKLLREINEINSSSRVANVWWNDGSVVVECSLFAEAVDGSSLSSACWHVSQVANDIGIGFAAMYDGSTPYAPYTSDSEEAA